MISENSRRLSELSQAQIELIKQADLGQLDLLSCPKCGRNSVSVRFTHPKANEYRTWFPSALVSVSWLECEAPDTMG